MTSGLQHALELDSRDEGPKKQAVLVGDHLLELETAEVLATLQRAATEAILAFLERNREAVVAALRPAPVTSVVSNVAEVQTPVEMVQQAPAAHAVPPVKPRGRRLWDSREIVEVRELHGQGLSVDQIAARMDRTSGSVMAQLTKMDLLGDAERFHYTRSEVDMVLAMHAAGKRPEEIAVAVGRGRCANHINSFLRYRGLLK